jgi:hypothetical protein
MGYTHYWDTKKWSKKDVEGYKTARPIIQDILNRYASIIQFEHDQQQKPVANTKQIRFNGIGEEGHETFLFHVRKNQGYTRNDGTKYNTTFNFTKTARKPYDIVVCEALLVLKAHMPGLSISSDGFYFSNGRLDGEWNEAMGNVAELYGIHYKIGTNEDGNPAPVFDKFVSAVAEGMTEAAVA